MNISKEKLIRTLEENLIPAVNSVELEKNSINDFQYRTFSIIPPNVAELYHVNSNLNEYTISSIITDPNLIKEIKDWYLTTAHKIKEEDINKKEPNKFLREIKTFPKDLQVFFSNFTSLTIQDESYWLYDVDLLLLFEGKIYRIIPLSEFLFIELDLSEEEINLIKEWIVTEQKEELEKPLGFIFIVGILWRNMIFYGSRGYRQMLLQAGQVISYFNKIAQENSIQLLTFNNFYDNKINKFLNLDGIESFVISIVAIKGKKK